MGIIMGFWRFIARMIRWSWFQKITEIKMEDTMGMKKHLDNIRQSLDDEDSDFGKDKEDDDKEDNEDFRDPKYNPYGNRT